MLHVEDDWDNDQLFPLTVMENITKVTSKALENSIDMS